VTDKEAYLCIISSLGETQQQLQPQPWVRKKMMPWWVGQGFNMNMGAFEIMVSLIFIRVGAPLVEATPHSSSQLASAVVPSGAVHVEDKRAT
jgi:hypothetical protein